MSLLLLLPSVVLACCTASAQAKAKPKQLYVYSSVGDNQWVSDWAPLDSKASIDGLFEYLAQTHGARRTYWRWVGDRMHNFRSRRETVLYWDFWEDCIRGLYEGVWRPTAASPHESPPLHVCAGTGAGPQALC